MMLKRPCDRRRDLCYPAGQRIGSHDSGAVRMVHRPVHSMPGLCVRVGGMWHYSNRARVDLRYGLSLFLPAPVRAVCVLTAALWTPGSGRSAGEHGGFDAVILGSARPETGD